MNAPQQGFAKGFRGDEEDTGGIQGQEMPEGAIPGDGLTTEPSGEPGTTEAAAVIPEGEAGAAAAAPIEGAMEEGAEGATEGTVADPDAAAEGSEAVPAEMNHNERSWNGRLTARESELKARADELDARQSEIEANRLPSYDEAVGTLTQDFGEDFVKLIQVVAAGATKGEVEKSTAELREQVGGVIEGVRGALGSIHSDMISSVHEDFEEIAESAEFKAFIEGMPDDAKAAATKIIESGSASQIVKLLTEFKKTLPPGGEGNDDARYDSAALDAAAGVRSSGGRAPSLGGGAAGGAEVDRFRAGFNS